MLRESVTYEHKRLIFLLQFSLTLAGVGQAVRAWSGAQLEIFIK